METNARTRKILKLAQSPRNNEESRNRIRQKLLPIFEKNNAEVTNYKYYR